MVKQKIGLYPDDDLMNWIKATAERENRSINNFCLMILKFFKDNEGNIEVR